MTKTSTRVGTAGGGGDRRGQSIDHLLAACSRGDHDAFAEFYTRLVGPTARRVQQIVRDPAMAEELTHDIMAEVWACADRFDPSRGTALAFVATIARRRAIDGVRSEQARRNRQRRVGMQRPTDGDVTVAVERDCEYQEVRLVLSVLSQRQREAIELAFWGGHNYPQVADHLDVPLGTLKSRIRDGLIRLRSELSPSEPTRGPARPRMGGPPPSTEVA